MSHIFTTYAGPQAIRRQKAYTKEDFLRTQFLFRLLFLVAFMAVLSLFYIWSRVQIVQYSYGINSLQQQQRLLREEDRRLEVEVAALKSPDRLTRLAGALHMNPPTQAQMRVMSQGTKSDEQKIENR